ncbi:hypothetical protein ACHAWF_006400 [Thalassiosira exigua]
MVVIAATAAASAAQAAGSVAATAAGLSLGKTDLDQSRHLFKLQMRQAKRLWAADWAENSIRHGEQCMQSAQQHAESQAMAHAAYYQSEKLALQGIKLARDQDCRAYEMAWRSEVRESLRDELANQHNRFNIVMLCDTVCLGCVFVLVAESTLPDETPMVMLNLYVLSMGLTIMLFTVSLWCAVMVVRRLHEHTASILERKLFARSEDLQKQWQMQLDLNLPTGAHESNLLHQAYEKWVEQHVKPMGEPSVHMMSYGVVMMFISAGLYTHNLYLIQYNALLPVIIFWSIVFITSTTVLCIKFREDLSERRKTGVYDNSWQDKSTLETGPFAKILRAAHNLFSRKAFDMARIERIDLLSQNERKEWEFCANTQSLNRGANSFMGESKGRARVRKDILQLLTTAAEELDALPEDLTVLVNKLLYEVDEANSKTAEHFTERNGSENMPDATEQSIKSSNRYSGFVMDPGQMMKPTKPIDAQRNPISLTFLRNKLGESQITTLLRLRNLSGEPLRLKRGLQLKEGQYIKRLKNPGAGSSGNNSVSYHLYPSSEIPPHSEVVIAARNNGKLLALSGIQGELCYTNRGESWMFHIKFSNELLQRVRSCRVMATYIGDEAEDEEEHWSISKEELDIKANNEILVEMNVKSSKQALLEPRQSNKKASKAGVLFKERPSKKGSRSQWEKLWVAMTPKGIVYSNYGSRKQTIIPLEDITTLCELKDTFAFEIRSSNDTLDTFSATSTTERDEWIQIIKDATGLDVISQTLSSIEVEETRDDIEKGYELVENGLRTVPHYGNGGIFDCVETEIGSSGVIFPQCSPFTGSVWDQSTHFS